MDPDTFICNSHQNTSKTSSSEALIKNGLTSSAARPPNDASLKRPSPHPPSVLSAPLNNVLKPVAPTPTSQSWTASAQKTQAARQKFFQAVPQVTETSKDNNRKPTEQSSVIGWPKVSTDDDDDDDRKSQSRVMVGKKLAEQNYNNNNKRPFTIQSADERW